MKFQGIILAGGKSRRFGEDKALAKIEGDLMIKKVAGFLISLKLRPVVIANDPGKYSFLPYSILKDIRPEQGPLGGLYTACHHFPGSSLLVLTCDMPFVGPRLLRKLLDQHKRRSKITFTKNIE